jgi:DNA polymerase-3 subunit beta
MRITCLQENLKRALATVGRAVAGKSTLPVLANVLLTTDGQRLKVVATNLEIAITHWIGGQVLEPGGITVPAKLLSDVVGGLPNEPITLTLDPRVQTVKLACGRFTTNIKGIEADEFPAIPTVAGTAPAAVLPAAVLREVIGQVAYAAATDDSRPVLAGVLVRLADRAMSMAFARPPAP